MSRNLERRAFPTNKLAAVVELLESEGVQAEHVLRDIGMTRAAVYDPQARISVRQLLMAYRNAVGLSRRPDVALKLGNSVQVTFYGVYGFAMLSCPTHRATIEFAVRYHALSCATAALGFRPPSSSPAAWTIKPVSGALDDARLYRFVVEVNAATIVALARDIVAPDYNPLRIRFAFPRPSASVRYEDIFGCEVQFDQAANEILVPPEWLDRPTRRADGVTFASVEQMCDRLLDEAGSDDGIAGDIRRMMFDGSGRFPKIDEIARRIGMSTRTLRRKLAADGTSYAGVLCEARAALAKTYLQDSELTIEDIADRVGYSDASNFRHAFLKWTGMTPTQYRRAARLAAEASGNEAATAPAAE